MSPALLQARPPHRYDHIDLESDKLSGNLAEALGTSLRPTILDRQGATLDPTEFAQSLDKGGLALAIDRTRVGTQISDGRHLPRLLRPRHERPRRCRAAECRQQLPPSDGDCHRASPCEVRGGNGTTSEARSLGVQGGKNAGCFYLCRRPPLHYSRRHDLANAAIAASRVGS